MTYKGRVPEVSDDCYTEASQPLDYQVQEYPPEVRNGWHSIGDVGRWMRNWLRCLLGKLK